MPTPCRILVLAFLLLPAWSAAGGGTVELLNYNVQNLPRSDFEARVDGLLELAAGYDLIVLQEDFAPDGLYSRWEGGAYWRGPQARWRWHNWLAFVGWPLGYRAPYDSGLSVLATQDAFSGPVVRIEPLVTLAFDDCHGIVRHSHDCWANKGLLGVRVTLENGAEFDLYTTHLDAGSGARDHAARLSQFDQMEAAIAEHSAGRAVVFAGDFNVPGKRPEQYADLLAFKRRLALENSGVHATHADWRDCQRDFIYIRSGADVRVEVLAGGEPAASTPGAGPEGVDFCDGDSWRGKALSDHPALAATLLIEPERADADDRSR